MSTLRSAHGSESTFEWLIRLRWVASMGQLATILVVHFALGVPLALALLLSLVGVGLLSNALLTRVARTHPSPPEWIIALVSLFDVALLTALLFWSGGSSNPFGILYLVQVTLAAIVSRPRWVVATAVSAIVGYRLQFLSFDHSTAAAHLGHHAAEHGNDHAFSAHLEGMFAAFVLATCLIAWFVSRVTRALAEERLRVERSSRLVGLTTLAAGAAHELATPLGTIKVAARELERAIEPHPDLSGALEDARLVRREVERSRAVLDRLAADAGEPSGEAPIATHTGELLREAVALIGERGARIRTLDLAQMQLCAPPRALARALANLLDNALDASDERACVDLSSERRGSHLVFEVRDQGTGIPAEIEARIGEPFFTTKNAGKGMGLGVFLVRSLAERLGGSLEHRTSTSGTTVMLRLPVVPG